MLGRIPAGETHAVTTTADERGAFRAALRPGITYSVWARSADGRLASGVVEDVLVGSRVKLVGGVAPRLRECALSFDGERIEGLQVQLVWGGANRRVTRLTLREDVLALPPLPRAAVRLECFSKDGFLVGLRSIALREMAARRIHWTIGDHATRTIVARAKGGSPLAGAEVYVRRGTGAGEAGPALERWNHDQRWYRVARTDTDGKARFRPHSENVVEALVTAPGFEAKFHGLRKAVAVEHGRRAPRKFRVLSDAQRPLAGAELLVLFRETSVWENAGMQLTRNIDRQPLVVTTGADGSVELPGIDCMRVELVLTRELRKRLALAPAVRSVFLAEIRGPDQTSVRVDQLVQRSIVVTRADGIPVPFAPVSLVRADDDGSTPTITHRTDRSGRLILYSQKGEHQVLAIVPNVGWGKGVVRANASEPLLLPLTAFHEMRVRVLDADGKAVPRARVLGGGAMWLAMPVFFRQVAAWNQGAFQGTCDERGELRVRLIALRGQRYMVSARDARGERALRGAWNVATDDLQNALELTLPRRKRK